jgi:hypothetical protein
VKARIDTEMEASDWPELSKNGDARTSAHPATSERIIPPYFPISWQFRVIFRLDYLGLKVGRPDERALASCL